MKWNEGMGPRGVGQRAQGSINAEARRLMREKPLVATAVAGALGVALGGFFFSRWARLVFVGAAGFAANELRRGGRRLDLDAIVSWLSTSDGHCAAAGPREE